MSLIIDTPDNCGVSFYIENYWKMDYNIEKISRG